jgi:NAD(P)-dependent dehydrogenase (short-subunit alcohol dehydrogenase family)
MPKTALVTGGAKRVGRALSMHLAARGYAVAVHFNRSHEAAGELVAAIRAQGGKAQAFQADLEQAAQVEALWPEVTATMGSVTVLVNNASLFEFDDIASLGRDSWHRHMETNLSAPLFLSQAFANALPVEGAGNIVNIVDQRVWKLTPNFMSYTLSKAGLWTLTQTLAQALAPRIRVNAIGPGPTLKSTLQTQEEFRRQQECVPLKVGPSLDEMCRALSFLLETPSITGQMIALDGGQHLAWQTPDVIEGQNQRRQRRNDP